MSFRVQQPQQQLMQYVRVPAEVRRLQGATRHLTPVGVLALVAAMLASIAYVRTWSELLGSEQISVGLAVGFAVIGGALALLKVDPGSALAAGGVAMFIGTAAVSVGVRINFDRAWHSTDAKLLLAAGVVGAIAAAMALAGLGGKGNAVLGAVIVVLSLVPPACLAALIHIDDVHTASRIAIIVGAVLVSLVTAIGAVKGRFGALASIAAASAALPGWIEAVRSGVDRDAAALAGMIAMIAIVTLALVILLVAATVDIETVLVPAPVPEWTDDHPAPPPVPAPTPVAVQPLTVVRTAAPVPPVAPPAMPTAAVVAPQWAPDPYQRFQVRYWNGKKWTDHVSTDGVTAIDPL